MSNLNSINLISLIQSCSFLPAKLIAKWEKLLPELPESFYGLIYKTFSEAKEKVDSLYSQFELSSDKEGSYKKLIKSKSEEASDLVKAIKLGNISEGVLS